MPYHYICHSVCRKCGGCCYLESVSPVHFDGGSAGPAVPVTAFTKWPPEKALIEERNGNMSK